jgi:hypothetical protein
MKVNLQWLRELFKPSDPPREVHCVPYAEADRLMSEDSNWKLAREEDRNTQIGYVYIERPGCVRTGVPVPTSAVSASAEQK